MKSESCESGSIPQNFPVSGNIKLALGIDPFPLLLFNLPLPQTEPPLPELIRVHRTGVTEVGLEDLEDDGLSEEEKRKTKRKNMQRAAARARYLAKKKLDAEAYEAYREARRQQQRRYYNRTKKCSFS